MKIDEWKSATNTVTFECIQTYTFTIFGWERETSRRLHQHNWQRISAWFCYFDTLTSHHPIRRIPHMIGAKLKFFLCSCSQCLLLSNFYFNEFFSLWQISIDCVNNMQIVAHYISNFVAILVQHKNRVCTHYPQTVSCVCCVLHFPKN